MTPDRAAEEAAIAAFIATKGVTRIDAVDPIDRAIEQWRREKDNKTGAGNGMRAMMQARRTRPRKVTQPQAVMPAAKPKRSHKKKIVAAVLVPAAEPWFAAAMRGPEKGGEHGPMVSSDLHRDRHGPVGCVAPLEDQVRDLAYALFERDGRVHGLDIQHWLTAEAILRGRAL